MIVLWIVGVICGWAALVCLVAFFTQIADEVRYPTPKSHGRRYTAPGDEIHTAWREWGGKS